MRTSGLGLLTLAWTTPLLISSDHPLGHHIETTASSSHSDTHSEGPASFPPDSQDSSLPLTVLRQLVSVERGSLPIILSVPHGGTLPIPRATERQGRGLSDFQTVRDAWTIELATACAAELERTLRGKPWLIVAGFDRKFLDVNRPAERAYESESAQVVYEYYHRSVALACQQVRQRWQSGLLLDIHGQGEYPDAICRGTLNGRTVQLLLDRHGWAALVGKRGLFGYLQRQGYKILPDCLADVKTREVPNYQGGYIVATYGSHTRHGIDAIQVEIGLRLREQGRWRETARDLATALAVYADEFLLPSR